MPRSDRNGGSEDGEYGRDACVHSQRFKAENEAQRGKAKGTLESEIRIAMLFLEQRPPRMNEGCLSGAPQPSLMPGLGLD